MFKSFSPLKIIHPLLLSIYPVLFLYAQNTDEIYFKYLILPGLVLLILAILLFLILNLFLKDTVKSALIVSLFLILFFSYGHIYILSQKWQIGNFKIVDNFAYILLLTTIIFFTCSYFIIKTKRRLTNLTKIVNLIVSVLVALSLFQISAGLIQKRQIKIPELKSLSKQELPKTKIVSDQLPNIYYIILDGYGQQAMLESIYKYDNSDFIQALEKRGFYIAKNARSNYAQTALSLSSSLNHQYLTDLANRTDDDRTTLDYYIKESQVRSFLKTYNYQTIGFNTGYTFTEIYNADQFIEPSFQSSLTWNQLVIQLYNYTPLPYIQRSLEKSNLPILKDIKQFKLYQVHANRLLFNYRSLADLPVKKEPFFAFAHLISPHPPFIFDKNGKTIDPLTDNLFQDGSDLPDNDPEKVKTYRKKYLDQLEFNNKKILETIDSIKSNSQRSTIIVIQGDHGPGSELHWRDADKTNFKERLSILNAYYFPDQKYDQLYPAISPVNTFKVIFNQYFGTAIPLEEDKSYFSLWQKPYQFIDVTEELK